MSTGRWTARRGWGRGRMRRIGAWGASLALVGVLLPTGAAVPAAAQTATFVVTTTADEVDLDPGDGACATASGACSLRAAIQQANALPDPVTIELVANTTYALSLPGRGEQDAATGDLDVAGTVTIEGRGAALDAQDLDRAIEVRIGGAATVRDLRIRNGSVTGEHGGGILVSGALALERSLVGNSDTDQTGGGVHATIWATDVEVSSSILAANRARRGGGLGSRVPVTVTSTTFTNNWATRENLTGGGGLWVDPAATAALTGSVFDAQVGGGACAGESIIDSGGGNVVADGSCGVAPPLDVPDADPNLVWGVPVAPSDAIDAAGATCPSVDYLGGPRPRGVACDAGAVETVHPALVVDVVEDTTDAVPGDGACADATGGCSLRAAVQEANALHGHDVIRLGSEQRYDLSIAGTGEDAAATGDLDIAGPTTIEGNRSTIDAALLDPDADGPLSGDRVLQVLPEASLLLAEAIVSGGRLDVGDGGGVLAEGAVELDRVVLHANRAGGSGGGLAVGPSSPGGAFTSSLALANTATGGGGLAAGSPLAVAWSTVAFNEATGGAGSAIASSSQVDLLASVAGFGTGTDCSGAVATQGRNLGRDGSCAAGPDDATAPDPLLYWGIVPLPGSPVIDAAGQGCPAVDLLEVARPQHAACDVGAVEFQAPEVSLSPTGLDPAFHVEVLDVVGAAGPTGSATLLVDGAPVATDPDLPLALTWDTRTVADGPHTLEVEVASGGVTVRSAPSTFVVNNALGVRGRLDADLARGALTPTEHASLVLQAAVVPASLPERYQGDDPSGGGTAAALEAMNEAWPGLSEAERDEVWAALEPQLTLPATPYAIDLDPTQPLPAAPDGGAGADAPAAANGLGDLTDPWDPPGPAERYPACGTETSGEVNFHVGRWCSMIIRYQGPTAGVPDLMVLFRVATGQTDDVPDVDANDNGTPDRVEELATEMFTAAVRYKQLDFSFDGHFEDDTPVTVLLANDARGFANPFDEHEVTPNPVTVPTRPGGGTWRSTARHELFHVVQYHYLSAADVVLGECGGVACRDTNLWWMELTAEWADHQVVEGFPDLQEPEEYLDNLDAFLGTPDQKLTAFDVWDGKRPYGAFIFAEYLQSRYDVEDEPSFVLRVFQELREEDSVLPWEERTAIEAVEDVVEEKGEAMAWMLPDFWAAAYLLEEEISWHPWLAMTDDDVSAWRGDLSQAGLDGKPFVTVGEVPDDGTFVHEGTVEPGGAAFVELEGADTSYGTMEVSVWLDPDRLDKVVPRTLQMTGSSGVTADLCDVLGGGSGGGEGGTPGGGGAASAAASAPIGGRSSNQDPAPAPVGAPGLPDGATADGLGEDAVKETFIVRVTPDCPATTVVVAHVDADSGEHHDDYRVEGRWISRSGVLRSSQLELGVNEQGNLILPEALGIAFDDVEGLAHGCACEGWGIHDPVTGLDGWANEDQGSAPDVWNLSFTASTKEADSLVGIGPPDDGVHGLEVRHQFHEPQVPDGEGGYDTVLGAFQMDVTITNNTDQTVHPTYRRTMDWDVPPVVFDEYVTTGSLQGLVEPLAVTNDGFAAASPVNPPTAIEVCDADGCADGVGWFTDLGPWDHGTLIDLDVGEIPPGGSATLSFLWGAEATEADAMALIVEAGGDVFSLGQGRDDPTGGTPATFFFAVKPPEGS